MQRAGFDTYIDRAPVPYVTEGPLSVDDESGWTAPVGYLVRPGLLLQKVAHLLKAL